MSEQEQEQTQEPVAPVEPVEPATEPEAPVEPEAPAEPEVPAEQPKQSATPEQIEAIYKRLDTRAANYVKSASEIIGDEGVPLTICEMCRDSYPGLRWSEPQDELHAKLLSIVTEMEIGAPLKTDPNAQTCETCDGFGVVKLPTHVAGKQTRVCLACNGVGYREKNPQSGALQPPTPAPSNGNGDVLPGLPVDDPRVISLKAEGYTVMPPLFTGEPAS